jgi:hypothetical protein
VSAPAVRLTAAECLQRGMVSLAANWELAGIFFVQSVAVTLLTLLGLLVPLLAVGVSLDPANWGSALLSAADLPLEQAAEFFEWLAAVRPLLAIGLAGTLVVWTVAFLVYSYLQAGAYGILYEADRRAPAAGAVSRRQLRAFDRRAFQSWASRRLWPFFWLMNLFGLYALVPILGYLLILLAASQAVTPGFVAVTGCVGLPLLLVPLGVVLLWFLTSQASLAEATVPGARQAARLGRAVLRRRLGAVLLLFAVFIGLGILFSILFVPLGLVVDLTAGDDLWVRGVAQLFLTLLQIIPNALLAVALGGALVALVRSETRSASEGIAA